ncbi:nucleotide exchange factor GrpE [Candidatus Shapirobacteria bacterium]|nr:nucleotide exchange factor GrpE [Candidatus Shapirobacteria bacterium]
MKTKSPKLNTSTQVQELKEKLARSLADYANLEKRIEAQRQMYVTLATVNIISKMIDVLDDLYLANSHLQEAGLKITIDKFVNTLASEGLSEIKTNTEFNPETMECIATVPGVENQIVSVEKRGYSLNGQVIRPTQVIVGKSIEVTGSDAKQSN